MIRFQQQTQNKNNNAKVQPKSKKLVKQVTQTSLKGIHMNTIGCEERSQRKCLFFFLFVFLYKPFIVLHSLFAIWITYNNR